MASGSLCRGGATCTVLVLTWLVATTANAQPREIAALRQQVKELTHVVQRLDERVGQLERQLSSGAGSTPPAGASAEAPKPPSVAAATVPQAPTAQPAPPTMLRNPVRDQWHRIGRGMTMQAVEALLGRPHRTMRVNVQTVWYYAYPDIGSGSVVFADDGSVVDWQTPPFNTWW